MSKDTSKEEDETKPKISYDQLFNQLKEAREDKEHFLSVAAMMYDNFDSIQNNIGKFKETVKNMMNNPPSKKPAVKTVIAPPTNEESKPDSK